MDEWAACSVQCENVLVVVAWTVLELGACAGTGKRGMWKANPNLKGRSEKGPGQIWKGVMEKQTATAVWQQVTNCDAQPTEALGICLQCDMSLMVLKLTCSCSVTFAANWALLLKWDLQFIFSCVFSKCVLNLYNAWQASPVWAQTVMLWHTLTYFHFSSSV